MRPKVIGVTGGIASGKTTVAEMLGSLGAKVIDADKMAHKLLDIPEVRNRLEKLWGKEILNETGKIDRRSLSRIVFSQEGALKELTDILHPPILEEIRREVSKGDARVIVLDAALLEETGLVTLCDLLIFVEAEDLLREKRVQEIRNWPPEAVARREEFQTPKEVKKKRAHYVINNNFSKEETFGQVKEFWNKFIL
jgi:dephospho-CoA kinase